MATIKAAKKSKDAQDIQAFQLHEKDVGSSSVQIARLTQRITQLTEHFKVHKKDMHSLYGLQQLSNQRKKLLNYLERTCPEQYRKVVDQLGLRS